MAFGDTGGEVSIRPPMPGLIVRVPVVEGQTVSKGETLMILESMKMENELKSPRDGTVHRIYVSAGENVEQNKVLVTIA
jgi:biotin carboxyl carrier protein